VAQPIAVDEAVSLGLLRVLPAILRTPLDTLALFQPDVGWLLRASAGFALGWGTLQTIANVLVLRRKLRSTGAVRLVLGQ
jgi:hypothetical protein